jgi:hypothetical protein
MKFRIVYIWDVFRLVLMVYLYVQQLSLRDMNGLCLRAEDKRLKKFRLTYSEGPEERRVNDGILQAKLSLNHGNVLSNPGAAV